VMDWRQPGGPPALMEFVDGRATICAARGSDLTFLGRHLEPMENRVRRLDAWSNILSPTRRATMSSRSYPVYLLRVRLPADNQPL